MPEEPFGSGDEPVGSVPIRLPRIALLPGQARPGDRDPDLVVPGDQVPLAGPCPADLIVAALRDRDAVAAVAEGGGPGAIGADPVPQDAVPVAVDLDAVAREAIDDEGPYRALAGVQHQAVRPIGDPGAVELDQGCSGAARLGRAVDDERIVHRRQGRGRRDRDRAAADGELDPVGPGHVVGVGDRLPERAGTAVGRAGHGDGREQATGLEAFHRTAVPRPPTRPPIAIPNRHPWHPPSESLDGTGATRPGFPSRFISARDICSPVPDEPGEVWTTARARQATRGPARPVGAIDGPGGPALPFRPRRVGPAVGRWSAWEDLEDDGRPRGPAERCLGLRHGRLPGADRRDPARAGAARPPGRHGPTSG